MKATYLKEPCPLLNGHVNKREISRIPARRMTFDYSLPQVWLDNYVNEHAVFAEERESLYWPVCSECVTVYPPHSVFGEVVNLITGEIL